MSGFTPACRITLDGIDITTNLVPAPFGMLLEGGGVALPGGNTSGGPLLSLTVTDNEDKHSDSVELSIDNRDHYPAPRKGSKFQVWLGYVETGLVDMGTFEVESWTKKGRPNELSVSAKAAGFSTSIKAPKSRSYHDTTAGEIVKKVAGYNGLGAIVHPNLDGVKIGHLDQSNESDVHFLTRLAERVGGRFKIASGRCIMNDASGSSLPSGGDPVTFDWPETGRVSWSAEGSERGSYGSAAAYYQDTTKGERVKVTEGSGKPQLRVRRLHKTKDEASQAAKAKLNEQNRGKVSYSCEGPGNPEIFSGALLNVTDHDPDVDGQFKIKSVTHTLDENGLSISISAESGNDDGGDAEPLTASGKESDGSATGADASTPADTTDTVTVDENGNQSGGIGSQ